MSDHVTQIRLYMSSRIKATDAMFMYFKGTIAALNGGKARVVKYRFIGSLAMLKLVNLFL